MVGRCRDRLNIILIIIIILFTFRKPSFLHMNIFSVCRLSKNHSYVHCVIINFVYPLIPYWSYRLSQAKWLPCISAGYTIKSADLNDVQKVCMLVSVGAQLWFGRRRL